MKRTDRIRQYLRSEQYNDGLTVQQLAVLCDTYDRNVLDALTRMPDAYIDRWTKQRPGKGRHAAVWCVVVPPANCPPPNSQD